MTERTAPCDAMLRQTEERPGTERLAVAAVARHGAAKGTVGSLRCLQCS